MTVASASVASVADHTQLPGSFLNCYEVMNPASLVWSVQLYKVVRAGGAGQSHGDRGEIKQAIWALRKQYSSLCRGYGFVVDVDEEKREIVVLIHGPGRLERFTKGNEVNEGDRSSRAKAKGTKGHCEKAG